MVVAAAAGGPIDVFGRIFAEKLSDKLGQRVVIENVGGGGGTVGGQKVARATPDGYTVLLGTVATHTNPTLLVDKPPYDPVADFTPVALVSEIPLVLITRKDFPANTLKEFVAYAKANQSKMNYGSAGVGSAAHLGCVMLDNAMGTHIQHVPYRGTSLAMQDLVSGRLDFLCEIAVTAVQNINAGTVKGIAVLSPNRSPVLPNIPTAAEEGLPSVQAYTWTALFLPKDTPAPIAAKLQKAAAETMDTPGLKEEMEKLAATFVAPERRSSAYLGQFVKDELTKWGNAMRASGVIPK
ncbi:tripartite tricarboxylate transporter substrate binding protein BugD [Pseudolabrys taiwanensis]|uniref:Tripartite tricarboxylate transporter substrate binding protein BugD n=2 Tax=Pseudolabrys taiwanensis TaxID=331696 RepID=A0A345ZSX9_9HYPH|nr:tripartite tricarboxylate transporter substrate binding protein BugD [Pseudolabrys taiwanensis]